MKTAKKVWTYLVIAIVALVAAVNYELFVFSNQFAPSGLNGICTMIQHITGISVGYLSLSSMCLWPSGAILKSASPWPCVPWFMWSHFPWAW